MDNNWKDILCGLRSSLEEPQNNSSDDKLNEEEENVNIQRQPLMVITDKKGRNGKIATIIEGFTISQDEVEDIARKLKQKLGVGGSVREGEILIQGDHKEKVKKFLSDLKFKTKG